MNQEHLEVRGRDEQLEARIASLEMAFRMQGEAQEAFDINRETEAVRKLYGEGEFANACLLSRRLVERGVRMVQIYYGNGQPWDDHKDITNHRDHAQEERPADRRLAARSQGPRHAGRHAGDLGGRVRPHARQRRAPRGATITPRASRCGWPAAA